MQPIMSKPHVHQLVLYHQLRFLSFLCRLLSIRCAIALPMGVAPEAIAEIFGYRLKKIDGPIPYISSHDICRLYLPFQLFSPSYDASPRVKDEVNLCLFIDIFLSPVLSSSFLYASFFLDTLILLYYRHFKYPEVYFGPCLPRGPSVRAYK
jgi:hypothetical protein